jgi:glucokinase
MHVIGIDLGGTKLAAAIFDGQGKIILKDVCNLDKRTGPEVGSLITAVIQKLIAAAKRQKIKLKGIGVSVPGIYYARSGRVWAPNIGGWDDYPLQEEIKSLPEVISMKVRIDSDRACYILGETWLGSAQGCSNAIFIAIGTGIGAGILIDGTILRGHSDIAGAIGWMALDQTFQEKFASCGHFEYYASGEGIVRKARELLAVKLDYTGILRNKDPEAITTHDVFSAFDQQDPLAEETLSFAIKFWGTAAANLVSTFNPEKIIFGGGVFGPAGRFISAINDEARLWAQPISVQQVVFEISALGGDAGLIGAGRLAML